MSNTTTIKGSAELVIKALQGLPGEVDFAVARGLDRGLQGAVTTAQRRYLSGPRPGKLDVVTRRLLNSITQEVLIDRQVVAVEWLRGKTTAVTTGSGDIRGRIGTNVPYAAFHEFGFHGVVHVSAHARSVSLDVTGKRIDERRAIKDATGALIGYKDTHAGAAKKSSSKAAFVFTGQVRAHDRNVNYDGRPYLKPALAESLEQITGEINAELKAINPGGSNG